MCISQVRHPANLKSRPRNSPPAQPSALSLGAASSPGAAIADSTHVVVVILPPEGLPPGWQLSDQLAHLKIPGFEGTAAAQPKRGRPAHSEPARRQLQQHLVPQTGNKIHNELCPRLDAWDCARQQCNQQCEAWRKAELLAEQDARLAAQHAQQVQRAKRALCLPLPHGAPASSYMQLLQAEDEAACGRPLPATQPALSSQHALACSPPPAWQNTASCPFAAADPWAGACQLEGSSARGSADGSLDDSLFLLADLLEDCGASEAELELLSKLGWDDFLGADMAPCMLSPLRMLHPPPAELENPQPPPAPSPSPPASPMLAMRTASASPTAATAAAAGDSCADMWQPARCLPLDRRESSPPASQSVFMPGQPLMYTEVQQIGGSGKQRPAKRKAAPLQQLSLPVDIPRSGKGSISDGSSPQSNSPRWHFADDRAFHTPPRRPRRSDPPAPASIFARNDPLDAQLAAMEAHAAAQRVQQQRWADVVQHMLHASPPGSSGV